MPAGCTGACREESLYALYLELGIVLSDENKGVGGRRESDPVYLYTPLI